MSRRSPTTIRLLNEILLIILCIFAALLILLSNSSYLQHGTSILSDQMIHRLAVVTLTFIRGLFLSCFLLLAGYIVTDGIRKLPQGAKLFGLYLLLYILLILSFYLTLLIGIPEINMITVFFLPAIDILITIMAFVSIQSMLFSSGKQRDVFFTWPNWYFFFVIMTNTIVLPWYVIYLCKTMNEIWI